MSFPLVVTYVALWILVVMQAVLLIGVIRAIHELRSELSEGATFAGRPVPRFAAVDLAGGAVSSESIAGKATVVLFISPDCPSCTVTLAELKPLAKDKTRSLVVVCDGQNDECARLAHDFDINAPVVTDEEGELKRLFGVTNTPVAVRISAQGVIESVGEPARGELLEELLADVGTSDLAESHQPLDGGKATVS